MSLKWIGAVLIVGGCGGVGFLMAWNYHRELKALRQLLTVLEDMRCELESRMPPLPELLRSSVRRVSGGVQALLLQLAEELELQIQPDVSGCMESSLLHASKLPERIVGYMKDLGNSLGVFDLPGQLAGLESIRLNCLQDLQELEMHKEQRTRSYQTLGLCAGAALAVLLI